MRRATFAVFEKLRNLTISIHALREEGDPAVSAVFCKMQNFYPRPPRGGRPAVAVSVTSIFLFLSTPSARRATVGSTHSHVLHQFLSTPSARRATNAEVRCNRAVLFLSTPSARRATIYKGTRVGRRTFLSTPSARRATDGPRNVPAPHLFLSTPSARRATQRCDTIYRAEDDFYPRPPRGGRPLSSRPYRSATKFLSTPSARRAT